jgi:hypothetical protein
MRRLLVLTSVVGAAVVLSTALGVSAHDRVTTAVTWDREIAPIVAAHCVSCHSNKPGTAVSLSTYETAKPWARAIRQQVLTRRMPVWRAARGYGEFANDPSLSPFEITLIVAWADGGAPKSAPVSSAVPAAAEAVESPSRQLFMPPSSTKTREQALRCGTRVTPTGVLTALQPRLPVGGNVRVMASWPNGDRRVLGWFRDGDPRDQTIYWLRSAIDLRTGVSILATGEPTETCGVALTLR